MRTATSCCAKSPSACGAALCRGNAVSCSASHRRQSVCLQPAAHTTAQTAGRIGGDEFVVVLEGVQGRDEASAVACRLMDVRAASYRIGGQEVHAIASIGVVTAEHPANDANTVMRDADTALHEAKRAGRSRYVLFDPAMHERLVRWVEPACGLRLALQRAALFGVNLPSVQLRMPGLIAEVQRCLTESHPAPEHLRLEVSESRAAQDDNTRAKLREHKAMGARIARNDFAAATRRWPACTSCRWIPIQIDWSFVMQAKTRDDHRVLIEAAAQVAQSLDMNAAAEGIEIQSPAVSMRLLPCERGQDYRRVKPLGADALSLRRTQRAVRPCSRRLMT